MKIAESDLERMGAGLGEIRDPRRQRGNIRHKLVDMPVIAFSSILCGFGTSEEIEGFGHLKEGWLKTFLELPNGIPDGKTFRDLFKVLDAGEVHNALDGWLEGVRERQEGEGKGSRVVNIDGKTIRGSRKAGERSGLPVVSAWVGDNNLTLGEVMVGEKSNETAALPELLKLLDIKGDVVTADAIHCQKETAKKIRKKEADYVLAVKENQPGLYGEIAEYFQGMESGEIREVPEDVWVSDLEKGHGRLEKREIRVVTDLGWLTMKEEWTDMKAIIQCRSRRTIGAETTVTDRYYISSLDTYADESGRYIRGHWSIENRLHWSLDVIFGEDHCGARAGNEALVFNVLGKAALRKPRALKVENRRRYSGRMRMMRAALDDDFLTQAIFGG